MTWNLSAETVVAAARKPHRCSWCSQRIEAGTGYHRFRWFDGNDAGTSKMHNDCHAAWSLWCEESQSGDEWEFGGMRRGCVCDPAGAGCDRCAKPSETSRLQSFPLSAIVKP